METSTSALLSARSKLMRILAATVLPDDCNQDPTCLYIFEIKYKFKGEKNISSTFPSLPINNQGIDRGEYSIIFVNYYWFITPKVALVSTPLSTAATNNSGTDPKLVGFVAGGSTVFFFIIRADFFFGAIEYT
jgi:hypothetical protein